MFNMMGMCTQYLTQTARWKFLRRQFPPTINHDQPHRIPPFASQPHLVSCLCKLQKIAITSSERVRTRNGYWIMFSFTYYATVCVRLHHARSVLFMLTFMCLRFSTHSAPTDGTATAVPMCWLVGIYVPSQTLSCTDVIYMCTQAHTNRTCSR